MIVGMTDELAVSDRLDPDDPRPASQQIANRLRAAIRTRKIEPGQRLPSQHELAERYDVARETVKAALRILRDERLIITRQGSGAFVRAQTERPVGLRPHIEEAFAQQSVTVDFAGFSGETLHGALTESLDKIRAGRLAPESLTVRILLPDPSAPMGLPRPVDSKTDDKAVRDRAERISRRYTEAVIESVNELADLGLVGTSTAEVRVHRWFPAFKLYILNSQEVFFGFYPVVEHQVRISNQPVAIYDVMGKDTVLFHRTTTDDETSDGPAYVEQAQAWFDSVWSTVATEYRL